MLGIFLLTDPRPKVVGPSKRHTWSGHTHRPGGWFSHYSVGQGGKGGRGYAPRTEMLSKDAVSMIVCTCNLRTPETEAGGFCV